MWTPILSGPCAMCGDNESLVDDHDHRTALIRGLLCVPCNKLEGWQQSQDKPFEGYRRKSPAIMLGLTIRYFDHFNGRYAEPVDEAFEADLMRRAQEAVMKIGFDLDVRSEDE